MSTQEKAMKQLRAAILAAVEALEEAISSMGRGALEETPRILEPAMPGLSATELAQSARIMLGQGRPWREVRAALSERLSKSGMLAASASRRLELLRELLLESRRRSA